MIATLLNSSITDIEYNKMLMESDICLLNITKGGITAFGKFISAIPSGKFSERPNSEQGIIKGFAYFCTDKQTEEGNTDGIMIYYKGEDTWVDALGRVVR